MPERSRPSKPNSFSTASTLCGQSNAIAPLVAEAHHTRDELMAWCETNGDDFIFGLARI